MENIKGIFHRKRAVRVRGKRTVVACSFSASKFLSADLDNPVDNPDIIAADERAMMAIKRQLAIIRIERNKRRMRQANTAAEQEAEERLCAGLEALERQRFPRGGIVDVDK
jgi:hypothetical protein